MRIGFASYFNKYHAEPEIADYLEKNHTVFRYHYPLMDYDRFLENDFDLFLTSVPHALPYWFVKAIQVPKIAWYFDWIQGYGSREGQYIPALKEFDLTLSTDGWIDLYKRNGIERRWLPHGIDPRVYHPLTRTTGVDVGFIGHSYTTSRKRLLQGLKKYNFGIFGNSDECWGRKYAEICNSVKIIVGDNMRNDIPGYWSDRLYLSMGCGAFLMYPRVPGIEQYFTDGTHLVLYDNEPDLHSKIDYYLTRPDERERIARNGAREVAKNHTWEVRVAEFETILKDYPKLAYLLS